MSRSGATLVLHPTEFCNASCAHCIVESGPLRKERLSTATGRAAIHGAARAGGFDMVVFSGGESTTYLDDVLDLCREARACGLRTRLVSNAYWARTKETAALMLERLFDDGVDELVVSFDEYHLPYVPAARVQDVAAGASIAARRPWIIFAAVIAAPEFGVEADATAAGFPASLCALLLRYGFDLDRCIPFSSVQEALGCLIGPARETFKQSLRDRIVVSWQPLSVGGRAARELAGGVPAVAVDLVDAPCDVAGRQITIPSSGRAYPCCSLWTNFPDHHYGRLDGEEGEFAETLGRIRRDPLVNLIHEAGPGSLVRWLRQQGVPLRDHYTDICSMCQALLSSCSLETLQAEAARCLHAQLVDGSPLSRGDWSSL